MKFTTLLAVIFGLAFSATAAPPKPKGVIAPKSLNRTYSSLIDTQYREFNRCQDADQARSKKRLRGLVLIRYIVSTAGKVTEAGPVHNTTKSRFLADCIIRNLERITFPSPGLKPVTASHTFKFRPGAVRGQK